MVNTAEGDPAGVSGAIQLLIEQGVDGIVISEPIDEGAGTVRVDVPVLVLGAPPTFDAPRVVTVGVDAEALARAATEHLLDLGHSTVHHLAGAQRWYAARDRLNGWRTALRARGRAEPTVIEGDWTAASGYAAGRALAGDASVTAVFAANDDMAIGLIRALLEAGRRVPDDISVVGFDDIPVAAYVTPPLTTVRQPFDVTAREGVKLLIQAIEKPDADPSTAVDPPVELIVRASTAPPPPRTIPALTTPLPPGTAQARLGPRAEATFGVPADPPTELISRRKPVFRRRLGRAFGVLLVASATLVVPAGAAQAYSPTGGIMYQLGDEPCLKGRFNCAVYPKSAQLPNGRLVASFEKATVVPATGGAAGETLPVYSSDDYGTRGSRCRSSRRRRTSPAIPSTRSTRATGRTRTSTSCRRTSAA